MRIGKLSARAVETAKPGKYGDGGGLRLLVSASGAKRWEYRYRLKGRRRDMGLGSYPAVSLADARERAAAARKQIAAGLDPIDVREAAGLARKAIPTFEQIAGQVIEAAQAKSRNAKVRYQWKRHLGPAYCSSLLPRAVNEITTLDVAKVLKTVWASKPEVARKLLPAIRRVFEHARIVLRDEHGVIMRDNPASWADLRGLGFAPPKKHSRGKHPHLAYPELPSMIAALRTRTSVAARCLEFLILTNARTGTVLLAEWAEFDLQNALWLVPPAHLKDGHHRTEPLRIPLAPRAMEILRHMKPVSSGTHVFPGQWPGKPLSQMAMLVFLRKLNVGPDGQPIWIDPVQRRPIVPHGFRATFRTWAEECTSATHAAIEEAMGHQVGTQVERAYRRTDILAKRRLLMEEWAAFCGGNVPGR